MSAFHDRLYVLGFASYADYLRSEHWQAVRRRAWAVHPWRCVPCGAPARDLHHRDYRSLGREQPSDLVPVCRACHGEVHALVRDGVPLKVADRELAVRLDFAAGRDAPVPDGPPPMGKRRKKKQRRKQRKKTRRSSL